MGAEGGHLGGVGPRRCADVCEGCQEARGYEIYRVQQGLDATDWKPMPSVGTAVREIRIHTKGEHRVIYLAKFNEGIYVLHAFEKKTRKTRREDVDLARKRLGDVLRDRGRRKTGPGKG